LLERNLEIVERNLPLLEAFFRSHGEMFEWVRPAAGPIGFPRLRGVADVERFCERLATQGVLLLPGSVYDEPGHVWVGFGRANLPEALAVLDSALDAPAAA
ncbi:MAG TPA: hypothetical protein VKJ07_03290, partial [Mycobacteriales bacterium]|nr:hypothetical protein [Mycobacteriales bacterium]